MDNILPNPTKTQDASFFRSEKYHPAVNLALIPTVPITLRILVRKYSFQCLLVRYGTNHFPPIKPTEIINAPVSVGGCRIGK